MTDKTFYIMLSDPDPSWLSIEFESGPNVNTLAGRSIKPVSGKIKLFFNSENDPGAKGALMSDIYDCGKLKIFSQSLISVLTDIGVENIEYFDTEVSCENLGENLDYKVANVVGLVAGLNLDKSDVVRMPDGLIVQIEKMVFNETSMAGNKIFRLEEDRMLVIVHKSIKEAIEKSGLKGFMFVSDDQYEPGMI